MGAQMCSHPITTTGITAVKPYGLLSPVLEKDVEVTAGAYCLCANSYLPLAQRSVSVFHSQQ